MVDLIKKTWRGTSRVDKRTFGRFDQATILAGNGNDRIEIDAAQGGLIDLGANNDYLSIFSFFAADGNQLVTTIDGGAGSDTLVLKSLSTAGLKWSFEAGKGWHVIDANEFAFIRNIETVVFEDGVRMSLNMSGMATITGTQNTDTIEATIDSSTRVTVNAGAGDDYISISGPGRNFSANLSLVDGGVGNDTLAQSGSQTTNRFTQSRGSWYLRTENDAGRWGFASRLVNIEKITYDDGSSIELGLTGVKNTAGNTPATLIGTSGDDTFKGSAGNDSFESFGGNDIFDLRTGGVDTIDFAEFYGAGLTEVTIIGRKIDDTLLIPSGESILSDNRTYNKDGINIGEAVLQWSNSATTVFYFKAS